MNRTVVELFAGCGGAALGLQRAGWHHRALIERESPAASTLRAAGFPVLEQDVREVDYAPLMGPDLVWASPPCQAGSVAGRRRGPLDDRNGWPWLFDAIDQLKPRWLLSENVRGWTFHTRSCRVDGVRADCLGCYWERVILPETRRRFPFSGTWVLNAADFGVPQHRRRVILWAGPLPLSPIGPDPTHADPQERGLLDGREAWVTLRDAVGSTLLDPQTCATRRCYPCDGTYGQACAQPWRLDLPAPTVTTTEVKGTRAHGPDWQIRRGPDRASDTAFLVAGVRRIEIHEGLTLQGFPRDWPLSGTRAEQYRQVGNAVPPPLAEALGNAMAVADDVWLATGQNPDLSTALAQAGEVVPLVRR